LTRWWQECVGAEEQFSLRRGKTSLLQPHSSWNGVFAGGFVEKSVCGSRTLQNTDIRSRMCAFHSYLLDRSLLHASRSSRFLPHDPLVENLSSLKVFVDTNAHTHIHRRTQSKNHEQAVYRSSVRTASVHALPCGERRDGAEGGELAHANGGDHGAHTSQPR
jgi:hypothetical protein